MKRTKKIINKLPNIICVDIVEKKYIQTINGKAEINEEIIKPEV